MSELPHRPELENALAAQRTERALTLVYDERRRQDGLRVAGRFAFTCADRPGLAPGMKLAVLVEEVGEVARQVGHFSPERREELREELVQVAAVAVAWIEGLE